ncbi:MAG: FAD:protein FMN transferase [Proteobacteria bacterium]|nr:FAD:protein FMN transferase [Pseudomonadota bacterium]
MIPSTKDPFLKPNRLTLRQMIGGVLVVGALLLPWLGRRTKSADPPRQLRLSGLAFSTIYEVKVVAKKFPSDVDAELRKRINKEISIVDETMSHFRRDSEISRFNRLTNQEHFKVSKEMTSVLNTARQISELSSGAFDVSVGPLVRLWGFHDKKKRRLEPDSTEIERVRSQIGFRLLGIDMKKSTIQKGAPELEIDLSAIAKGYAVDRIAAAVERVGYSDYLVEIGGEVRARGLNARRIPWRIGIEKPITERRETFQVIELTDTSVATSGDYRNFYDLNGRRISHTIDPRTGYPISHRLASVSVVHKECTVADALATALTVLGPKDGFELAIKEGLPVLFVTRDENNGFTNRATPEFERIQVRRSNPEKNGAKQTGNKK